MECVILNFVNYSWIVLRWVDGWMIKDEYGRIWKEDVVAQSTYYPGISLERLQNSVQSVSEGKVNFLGGHTIGHSKQKK
jgi:hypothetical protein